VPSAISHRSRLPIDHAAGGRPVVSPDGLKVAVSDRQSGASHVYSLSGQHLRDLPQLSAIEWSSDSRSLFVFSPGELPIRIQKLDVASGALAPWKEIVPTDAAGSLGRTYMAINPAGDAYVYSIERMMTDLFIVDGLH
jgi:hypothetical protein